jgi:antitoxin HigA-1
MRPGSDIGSTGRAHNADRLLHLPQRKLRQAVEILLGVKTMRKMKRRPTHPGNIIKQDYLLPLSISIKDMADTLGVPRKALSKIINEQGAITPDMALRLSRAFDTTPDLWLNLLKNYDLWNAENSSKEWQKVKTAFPNNAP